MIEGQRVQVRYGEWGPTGTVRRVTDSTRRIVVDLDLIRPNGRLRTGTFAPSNVRPIEERVAHA